MAVNRKILRLTFTTAEGNGVSIALPDPKADLTKAQIEAVMDEIIAKDIFITPNGALTEKKDIKLIDFQTEDLNDPE